MKTMLEMLKSKMGGGKYEKIIILLLTGIIIFSSMVFAGDDNKDYATHSTNLHIQTEVSE
ncbi:hypothetical protein [Marinitoga lauensis]|uniref:hypothetical protein n=1 Tax=Marinitoga lauensis TaxID=2201189 RepID=UPI0010115E70|nr:hypothetical protein [Marinitoga lauensis]